MNEKEKTTAIEAAPGMDMGEFWFDFKHIRRMNTQSGLRAGSQTNHYTFVAFLEGSGWLRSRGTDRWFRSGACLIIPPGEEFEYEGYSNEAVIGASICFDLYKRGKEGAWEEAAANGLFAEFIQIASLSRLAGLLKALETTDTAFGAAAQLNALRKRTRFQELIIFYLENAASEETATNASTAIERAVVYLESNYREPITVEQLWKLSGVSRSQFSALFQAATGRKPLDYLTEVRIRRAKELLALSNDPLREIARSIGFKDEYYFNRRFRQVTGISPKQFGRLHQRSGGAVDCLGREQAIPLADSRVVAIGYALGDLLALGLRPIGADLSVIGKQVVFRNELEGIEDVGLLGDPVMIAALQPQSILYCSFEDESLRALSQIAPTFFVKRNQPTYERLRQVAALFNKKKAAEKWIASHMRRSEMLWKRLNRMAGQGETAAVIAVVDGRLYAMGARGMAQTLYQPQAFLPAPGIRRLINEQISFQLITEEALPDFAGDRLFLLVNEEEPSRRKAFELTSGPIWTGLEAVRRKRAYRTSAQWNYDDPITMDRLLLKLPDILGNPL
ncbi:AraC family transcriptional regulator [Paenibacillus sp. HB172176]|uniref:helix-turn-helix domain-containing protein n=1 Tax=Paenibacillus sp. HB172176 TaxID=2493690 RepID=UPI00143B39AF|nr:AraC family transcriptional regulator [Paenibacillus sp. HB172176]